VHLHPDKTTVPAAIAQRVDGGLAQLDHNRRQLWIVFTIVPDAMPALFAATEGIFLPLSILQAAKARILRQRSGGPATLDGQSSTPPGCRQHPRWVCG
jgi:hypothetical protein